MFSAPLDESVALRQLGQMRYRVESKERIAYLKEVFQPANAPLGTVDALGGMVASAALGGLSGARMAGVAAPWQIRDGF